MHGGVGRACVHTHAHKRQPLPWKWIRWQMVSEPELLSRAELTPSCSPELRDESSKDKPLKKGLINSWQSALSPAASGTTSLHLLPSPSRVLTGKILSEMETKEETNVCVQPPSVRNTRGSVFHRETRTCYYPPKYQNPAQSGGNQNTQLKIY